MHDGSFQRTATVDPSITRTDSRNAQAVMFILPRVAQRVITSNCDNVCASAKSPYDLSGAAQLASHRIQRQSGPNQRMVPTPSEHVLVSEVHALCTITPDDITL